MFKLLIIHHTHESLYSFSSCFSRHYFTYHLSIYEGDKTKVTDLIIFFKIFS